MTLDEIYLASQLWMWSKPVRFLIPQMPLLPMFQLPLLALTSVLFHGYSFRLFRHPMGWYLALTIHWEMNISMMANYQSGAQYYLLIANATYRISFMHMRKGCCLASSPYQLLCLAFAQTLPLSVYSPTVSCFPHQLIGTSQFCLVLIHLSYFPHSLFYHYPDWVNIRRRGRLPDSGSCFKVQVNFYSLPSFIETNTCLMKQNLCGSFMFSFCVVGIIDV